MRIHKSFKIVPVCQVDGVWVLCPSSEATDYEICINDGTPQQTIFENADPFPTEKAAVEWIDDHITA